MPESKKISQLPAFATVVANDILPIVDASLTQTGKCTAAQIAAIGGGPPGNNSVITSHIQDGAVTAIKVGFTGPDKLVSRIAAGAGGGVEFPCSPYARGLLAMADGSDARAYLDALQSTNGPAFTGQVKFAGGSAALPSIVRTDSLTSGIFFPQPETVAMSIAGVERWRLQGDGAVWMPILGFSGDLTRPTFPARGFVNFNGTTIAGQVTSIITNQRLVASRYGLAGTLADNEATRNYITTVETARGITIDFPATPTFSYNGTAYARKNQGTENRPNYTSPGDNTHWSWNGTAFVPIAATGVNWLGTLNFVTLSSTNPVYCSGNIVSVTRTSAGVYRCYFSHFMPTPQLSTGAAYDPEQYCALVSTNTTGMIPYVSDRNAGHVEITVKNSSGTVTDVSSINVAIFR